MGCALWISKEGKMIDELLPILETAKFDGILHLKSIKKQGRSGRVATEQLEFGKGIGTVPRSIF